MKICRFFPIRFPSLNEWIAAAKSGRGKYNAYSRMKDTFDRVVALWACKHRLPAFPGEVVISFVWAEKKLSRDLDNVAAGGRKPLLDGLVLAGVLPDDGPRFVKKFGGDELVTGPNGVWVTLEGETDGQPARPRDRQDPRAHRNRAQDARRRVSAQLSAPGKVGAQKDGGAPARGRLPRYID
jgi:hypothetical protein